MLPILCLSDPVQSAMASSGGPNLKAAVHCCKMQPLPEDEAAVQHGQYKNVFHSNQKPASILTIWLPCYTDIWLLRGGGTVVLPAVHYRSGLLPPHGHRQP